MQRNTLATAPFRSKLVRGVAPTWAAQPMQQQFERQDPQIVETDEEKADREAKEKAARENETPEQKAAREAKEAKAATDAELKKAREAAAEAVKAQKAAEKKLADKEKENLSETERQVAEKTEAAVASAVAEKETELTDAYEGRIAALQKQIIDGAIDTVLAEARIERKDVSDLIESLDSTRFIDDDGSVKVEAVRKALSSLSVATSKLPPRTSSSARGFKSENRGMGRYLNDK